MKTKDYSYIKPGYSFPISEVKCKGFEYSKRDKPTKNTPQGRLRHYVICECPFCHNDFEGRIDRLESTKNGDPPRTYGCEKCTRGKKRPWKDPWRHSINNKAEKQGININRVENLAGKIHYYLLIGNPEDGYTDKNGIAFWPCTCLICGKKEFNNHATLFGNKNTSPKTACSDCLNNLSAGALTIKNFLEKNKIKYKQEYSFEDLIGTGGKRLRFDFAIFNSNNKLVTLIEFDGEQHYKPIEYFGGETAFKTRKIHDNLKNEYCKKNKIKLIRIPYNFKDIKSYLNNLLTFS